MTLGLRYARTTRTPRLKPCRFGCGVLVLSKCAARACEACAAQHGVKVLTDRLDPKYRDLTPAEIDQQFRNALAAIKRRPRPDPDLGWTSPLARLG